MIRSHVTPQIELKCGHAVISTPLRKKAPAGPECNHASTLAFNARI